MTIKCEGVKCETPAIMKILGGKTFVILEIFKLHLIRTKIHWDTGWKPYATEFFICGQHCEKYGNFT